MHASATRTSPLANAVFTLLDPLPFGCFAAALVFDVIYSRSAEILWVKGAAWLITFGLLFAIVPRLINLAQVWFTSRAAHRGVARVDFLLNLAAIVVAIVNAFVHSRDAYGVMPDGMWLSLLTVALIALGRLLVGWRSTALTEVRR